MALVDSLNYVMTRQKRYEKEREKEREKREKKKQLEQEYKKDLKYYLIDILSFEFDSYGCCIYSILCKDEQKDKIKRSVYDCLVKYYKIKNIEQINVDVDMIYFETLNKILTRYKKIEKASEELKEFQEIEEENTKKNIYYDIASFIVIILITIIKSTIYIIGLILFFIFGVFSIASKS